MKWETLKKQSRELAAGVLTIRDAQNLAKGNVVLFFIIAIIIDLIGHNIPLDFNADGETLTESYWYKYDCLNSLSFVGYILFAFIASQKYSAFLKVITFNWLSFAISDFIQELLSKNTYGEGISFFLDWGLFILFVSITILHYREELKNRILNITNAIKLWAIKVRKYFKN
jgi:hypothetical protein